MTRWLTMRKAALEERLQRLRARTSRIEAHHAREADIGVGDQVDHAQVHADDEVVSELELRGESAIPAIEAALARIELGTYETCVGCGDVIGHGRLEVMPETTLCADCAALSSGRR